MHNQLWFSSLPTADILSHIDTSLALVQNCAGFTRSETPGAQQVLTEQAQNHMRTIGSGLRRCRHSRKGAWGRDLLDVTWQPISILRSPAQQNSNLCNRLQMLLQYESYRTFLDTAGNSWLWIKIKKNCKCFPPSEVLAIPAGRSSILAHEDGCKMRVGVRWCVWGRRLTVLFMCVTSEEITCPWAASFTCSCFETR